MCLSDAEYAEGDLTCRSQSLTDQKSIVVQYVLSGQRQILVCETATILFAFCGTSLKTSQSEVTVEECASTLS